MPWSAIGYVSSGVTLVAFVCATVAWILRLVVLQRERMIMAAPEAKRAELVARALESFHINTEKLTKAQQYDLAVRQITERAGRFRTVAIVVILLAILASGVSIPALMNIRPEPRQELFQHLTGDLNSYLDRVRNISEDIRLKRLTSDEIRDIAPKYNSARQILMRSEEVRRQEIRTQWNAAAVTAFDTAFARIFGGGGVDEIVFEMNRSSVDRLREKQSPDYDALAVQHRKLSEQVGALESDLHALYELMGAEVHLRKTYELIREIRRAGT